MSPLPPVLADAALESASPAWTRVVLERLTERDAELGDRLAADDGLRAAVVAVTGISNSLTRLIETDREATDVLAHLDHRPPLVAADATELARWKSLELLRIAARDQLGVDRLEHTVVRVSRLAADVLQGAVELVGVGDRLAVVGMGKLGGYELNYASDIDVMFACDDGDDAHGLEAAARAVLDLAGRSFRVDADLRPEGRNGPLVRTVSSYESYWDGWADPWEFQALLKAAPVAGAAEVGARFASAASESLWSRRCSADDLRSLRELKARAEHEVSRRSDGAREVKRSPGGIRDVEFSIQLLQLVHGPHDAALRDPNTLVTIGELGDAGYIDAIDAERLVEAYRFLRALEHRLQLVEEQPVYAVPAGHDQRMRLARAMGFRDTPAGDAAAALDVELARQRNDVRSIHERLYFRPLLEAFADAPGAMGEEAVDARLSAFGFTDARRTRAAAIELTRGLTRSSRLMQQLLPLLLEWLSSSPDPDLGLLGLRTVAAGPQRTAALTQAFRDSPETARRLCLLLGTSRLLGELLHHNPDLAASLTDDELLTPRSRADLVEGAATALAWRADDPDARQHGLNRFTDREGLRLMAGDVLGLIDTRTIGAALTDLAESALEAALAPLAPPFPFAVIAMGRFGGRELSYASDLDVVFVHDGDGDDVAREANRVASELLRFMMGPTPARRLYAIDADLRPEGKDGLLSRSVDGFTTYFERWAQPWERQAFVRARWAAGDAGLADRLLQALTPAVWDSPVTDDDLREIRRIKARVERERFPAGEDPEFHLKLGKGALTDVEFCVQLLQLQHRIPATGTLDGLARLVGAGVVTGVDAAVLEEAWRFCEHTRNRLHLVRGAASNALPQRNDELAVLARSLGSTPTGLREEFRRLTRRSRRVVERLFYARS